MALSGHPRSVAPTVRTSERLSLIAWESAAAVKATAAGSDGELMAVAAVCEFAAVSLCAVPRVAAAVSIPSGIGPVAARLVWTAADGYALTLGSAISNWRVTVVRAL